MNRPLFSILHPSARPDKWKVVYADWMAKCSNRYEVEYILCADERWGFDPAAPKLQGHAPFEVLRTVWNTGRRCYVDAVNIAAKAATGQILIVIADDQFACSRWDAKLADMIAGATSGGSVAGNREFVIEVSTGTPNEHERGIFVMPIVSRARYEALGYLFYPAYESMFADNDLCSHARQDGIVIDVRHLMFPHRHPAFSDGHWVPNVVLDETYKAQNRPEAYELGARVFAARSAGKFMPLDVLPESLPDMRHQAVPVYGNSAYLDLLRQVLTRSLFIDNPAAKADRERGGEHPLYLGIREDYKPFLQAETMIGDTRLRNIQECAEKVIREGVEGDFMECGVWRGGAAIFMRAILKEYSRERSVWVADSFEGLPAPDAAYPADAGDKHHTMDFLSVSIDEVKRNFSRYGMLDDRVKFLRGFFRDTLPGPVEKLALLRIDADMYEGVTQALEAMYPKVSEGGYIIIDDYQNLPATRKAVDDFAESNGLRLDLHKVDWCAAYWKKDSSAIVSKPAPSGRKVVHLLLPGQTFSQAWVRNLTVIMAGLNSKGYACVPHFFHCSSVSISRNVLAQNVLTFSVSEDDYVLWIDDDNLVEYPQALRLLAALDSHPEADMITGWTWIQTDYLPLDAQASCGIFDERGCMKKIASFVIEGEPELYEVEWSGFPVVAMRRQTIVKAGKNCFSPLPTKDAELGFGLYGEDVSFSLRLRQNGGRIFVDPSVYVPHLKLREALPSKDPVPTVNLEVPQDGPRYVHHPPTCFCSMCRDAEGKQHPVLYSGVLRVNSV